MVGNDSTRLTLKSEFFHKVEALGLRRTLFPSQEEPVDALVQQLELINPIPHPLQPNHLPSLLGRWQLVYASQGTVVTRWFTSIPDWSEGINIKQVWQTLKAVSNQKIAVENGAVVDFPLLGEWYLGADGVWTSGANEQVATVTFSTFSFQATKPFGQERENLDKVKTDIV